MLDNGSVMGTAASRIQYQKEEEPNYRKKKPKKPQTAATRTRNRNSPTKMIRQATALNNTIPAKKRKVKRGANRDEWMRQIDSFTCRGNLQHQP